MMQRKTNKNNDAKTGVSFLSFPSKPLSGLIFANLLLLSSLVSGVDALFFNFSSFDNNPADIILDWDATFYGCSVYLTKNPIYGNVTHSSGRALYRGAVRLWEANGSTPRLADFTAHFSFNISNTTKIDSGHGHGLAFFVVPETADWHPNWTVGASGLLGLFESDIELAVNGANRTNPLVAVEFDTKMNTWDPSGSHVGIDVNSIRSERYVNVIGGFMNRGTAKARVAYDSAGKNLSVSLGFTGSLDSYSVSYIVDLSTVLPERVRVCFTATTGVSDGEAHQLYSWSFNSSLADQGSVFNSFPSSPTSHKKTGLVVVGVAVGLVFVALVTGVALYRYWSRKGENRPTPPLPVPVEDLGPREFSYGELVEATNEFDPDRKLGRGGFGDVYKGTLPSSNEEVAIKRFRSGVSSQGETEFISEINVISRLRHKNLVQLKGWCNENRELLLVYEFMPNRSLDFYLFTENEELILPWPKRYNIAHGLASAMNYLQNESNQSVVHRDIKSSNIMLDRDFDAKLGDFGLARLTAHGQSFDSTNPAGTRGYQAPELLIRWEGPTKASDVYSFGVVALELATGKKAILSHNRGSLVDWVWEHHAEDTILEEAIDERVKNSADFNEDEAMRLIMIGLACCNPNASHRPTIEQVKDMLKSMAVIVPDIPRVRPELADASSGIDRTTSDASETEYMLSSIVT